jgi:tetrahydrodipicolinate N-acetyltransferase
LDKETLLILSGISQVHARLVRMAYRLLLPLARRLWGIEYVAGFVARSRFPKDVLKLFGARIGEGVWIEPFIVIHAAKESFANLTLGNRVFVGKCTILDLTAPIEVGDEVGIGMRCNLITHLNLGNSPLMGTAYTYKARGVQIEAGAVVATGATILDGVQLGRCSIVSAGAVVSQNVPPYTVVAGNPARIVKRLESAAAPSNK